MVPLAAKTGEVRECCEKSNAAAVTLEARSVSNK
jgi:hypothetical protein